MPMDQWKRASDGSLINDDEVGYGNAKKRLLLKNKRKEEKDVIFSRLNEIEQRMDKMEQRIESLGMALNSLIAICKNMTGNGHRMM